MSEQQIINIGTLPNDGDGDALRQAFNKINENFANVVVANAPNANITFANIAVGNLPNDGEGDPLRTAFEKINNNFSTLANANLLGNSSIELVTLEPINEPEQITNIQNIVNINQVNIYNSTISSVPTMPLPRSPYKPIAMPTVYTPNVTVQIGPFGNQEYINIGNTPNDGQGDPLRVAFNKINNNFSNLFFTTTNTTISYTVGLADQIIFETEANEFTQAEFQIRSTDSEGPNSQSILISAQIKNSGLGVRWTGYATTFEGDALTRYDMDVIDGNVVIIAQPIANTTMTHFIASSVTWQGSSLPGLDISLDGYANSIMSTENDLDITTEN